MVALGDLGENPQRMLVDRLAGVTVDVVKVSHHGSADQYPPLYGELHSRLALVGVGATNRYGHPAPTVVDFLTTQNHHIIRSDSHGTSTITKKDDGEFQIWTSQKR
jgi:competence protein ComEC